MFRHTIYGALVASILIAPAALVAGEEKAAPEEASSLVEALAKGKPVLSFRYRYENVSDDGVASGKDANASTLRTVVGYKSLPFKGWSAYIEAENVLVVGDDDDYRNLGAAHLSNGVTNRPVIADPAITEINQAFIQWQGSGNKLRLGRQEVLLGDHRYVGHVGWRQNHQSYDAFTFSSAGHDRVSFFYGYLDNANRITGANLNMESHLLNVGLKLGSAGKLTAYGYLLDFDTAIGLSTQTFGLEFAGKHKLDGGNSLLYELELADQSDAGNNPNNVSAGYRFAMLGAAFKSITVKVGYEILEGSPGNGRFTTPLATLHKFNGWADKFLNTPGTGLEDIYIQLGGKIGKIGWTLFYHDFSAETGSANYGDELDIQLVYKSPKKQVFGLKGALYSADSHSADTDKWMLFTAYKI